jgi:GMP synthase (glutamine-hydrolysing) A subunit
MTQHDRILILDFGSQVTQLIARRLRETGVYCEVWPFNAAAPERIHAFAPKGIIFSGGPASVTEGESPRAPAEVFAMGLPILGICYGQQTMAAQLGGTVEGGHAAEFGRAVVTVTGECALTQGLWAKGAHETVWMSHGDRITVLPPGFRVVAESRARPSPSSPTTPATTTAPCSTPRWCTPRTARAAEELHPFRLRLHGRLDHGRLPRRGHRPHPRPGRHRGA